MRALWPILFKEVLHIVRDARSLVAILLLPLFLLLLFGYAISFDVRDIPIVVVDQDRSPESRALVQALTADGTVRVVEEASAPGRIDRSLEDGSARMGLVIPPSYAARLANAEQVPIQVLVDGTDASFAGQALQHVGGVLRARAYGELETVLREVGGPQEVPGLVARPRVLFNEPLDSRWYIVPGLIAIIVSMLAATVTSQCVAREYETGTIEQILVSPVSGLALMLGKLIPYVGIGIVQVLMVLVASRVLFGVPIRGSLWLLGFGTFMYLVGSMAFGLMLSAVLKNQQVAMQISFIATMLPSLLLSGFVFPIENMAWPLRMISYAVAARYYVGVSRGLFLKAAGLDAVWPDLLAMTIYATVLVVAATSRFRRSLA